MTQQKLTVLVTEAVQLDRKIAEMQDRLKEVKALLIGEGAGRPDEHTATEGGGTSWTAVGCDGCIARVTWPAPALKSKISGEGRTIEKVRTLAGSAFERLFRPVLAYQPVPDFRDEAVVLLGRAAPKLIRAVESESAPKVAFETKEVVA